MKFDIGDKVEWESQSRGITKIKTGEIVFIVPIGSYPYVGNFRNAQWDGSTPRKNESYVIRVQQTSPRTVKHYWPRTEWLKPIESGNR